MAVLEPRGWSPAAVARLRGRGVRVLAYLSVLELPQWEIPATGLGSESFLHVQGAPWFRPEYDTVVVDPRVPSWRRYLEGRALAFVSAGWDGLFLDGLGDLEDPVLDGQLGVLLPAAATLVGGLRQITAGRLLVVNNGIWSVLPWIAPHLDAVCWEVAEAPTAVDDRHIGAALEALAAAAVGHGVGRWLLTAVAPDRPDAARRASAFTAFAAAQGFVAYVAPGDYALGVRGLDGGFYPAPRPPAR